MTLLQRETSLFSDYYSNWIVDLPGVDDGVGFGGRCSVHCGLGLGDFDFSYTFRRGFVEEVSCTPASWADAGDIILSQEPVTKVILAGEPEEEQLRELGKRWPRLKFVVD